MLHSNIETRYTFLLIAVFQFLMACSTSQPVRQGDKLTSFQQKIAALESSSEGRIGLSAVNTGNNLQLDYRSEERFPLCSTSKVFVVSAILKESMKNKKLLQQKLSFNEGELRKAGYSPITGKNLGTDMSISELCKATIQYSDNTAANLLMRKLGGPKTVTSFARSIGDQTFSLDRWEPELNSAVPGDVRDTSTPAAVRGILHQLLLGNALGREQREHLQEWLKGNTTGASRIRAGTPKDWVVGEKTGTGFYGTTNDIGIIWPPQGKPIIVAIYYTQGSKDASPREEVIALVTKLLVDAIY